MKKYQWIWIAISLLVIINCRLLTKPKVKIINHDAPALTVDTQPFRQAGCLPDEYGIWTCPKDNPMYSLGCEQFASVTDLLGGLDPSYPIIECRISNLSKAVVPIQEGDYFYQKGCLRSLYVRYIFYKDGKYKMINNLDDLKSIFAPINSSKEALSYALAATGLGARFGLRFDPDYRYLVQTLEDTKVVQTKDRYEVNLYHYQLCGCGPHTTSIVKVVVTKEGEISTNERVPAFEDPKQDNLCID